MKRLFTLIVLPIIFGPACLSTAEEQTVPSKKDQTSYSIGYQIGSDFKNHKVKIRTEPLLKGVEDAMNGNQPVLSEAEMRSALRDLQGMVSNQRQKEMNKLAEENGKAGAAFLAENSKKNGVVTLPSGLQYLVIQQGDGPLPSSKDTVIVNYRGTLVDGSEFDNSFSGGKPLTLPVSGVIQGWTEALQLMKIRSKWRLFIPPDLAYGQTGSGSKIGPNATLIYDVELLAVKSKANADKPNGLK